MGAYRFIHFNLTLTAQLAYSRAESGNTLPDFWIGNCFVEPAVNGVVWLWLWVDAFDICDTGATGLTLRIVSQIISSPVDCRWENPVYWPCYLIAPVCVLPVVCYWVWETICRLNAFSGYQHVSTESGDECSEIFSGDWKRRWGRRSEKRSKTSTG